MKAIDLGWAAGFYEGEGSIAATGHALMLTIAQVNREPLDRFLAVFGAGSLRWDDRRQIHIFRAFGGVAQDLAMQMWPHLSARRQNQILKAVMHYVSRPVRDPEHCRRGHRYADVGMYRGACAACNSQRKRSSLGPAPRLPRAIEIRLGVREYVPPTMATARGAVAWTFGKSADEYAPALET